MNRAFTLRCSRCGQELRGAVIDGTTMWLATEDQITEGNWLTRSVDGQVEEHYCPACQTFEERAEATIREAGDQTDA